jgi:two-component system, NtrC family, nitrogen regulation response regulator NtrX
VAKILVVDDEILIVKTLSAILQDEGHIIFSCGNGKDTLAFVSQNTVDLIFLDVWLPDIDGIEVLERINQTRPGIAVIMISGHASIDIAVKATRMGALDFLDKPLSMQRVITSLSNALERVNLKNENIRLRSEAMLEDEMIGESESIKEVKKIIETAAGTNARVFITGENGTGKELVAKAVHKNSKRSSKPMIKVNCAAIPDELIESELFGHEKGSFTGASSRRLGKFEVADGGTIFLDEICDMSASAQAKVLRVLQEQQFERVGGNEPVTVDVRVIAATNIDVKSAIEEGKFREDLYYRLNVIPINVPSLSDREDDIPLLTKYFLNAFSKEHGLGEKDISDKAMKFLCKYKWPGNVRELKNIIERLCIMVQSDVIDRDDIAKHLESYDYEDVMSKDTSTLKQVREEFEKEYIRKILRKNEKNITATAKELGIERTNLHRKIKQYNINIDKL